MNKHALKGIPVFTLLLFLVPAAPGNSEIRSGRIQFETENMEVSVGFGERDERRIREYYERTRHQRQYDREDYDDDDDLRRKGGKHVKGKTLPPGLAKKHNLPPGLERQITKNGKLPPGLHGRLLPHDLERTLHPLPEPYVRVRVEGDVVIMDRETSIVIDVIHDVHRILSGSR